MKLLHNIETYMHLVTDKVDIYLYTNTDLSDKCNN